MAVYALVKFCHKSYYIHHFVNLSMDLDYERQAEVINLK